MNIKRLTKIKDSGNTWSLYLYFRPKRIREGEWTTDETRLVAKGIVIYPDTTTDELLKILKKYGLVDKTISLNYINFHPEEDYIDAYWESNYRPIAIFVREGGRYDDY